MTSRVFSSSGVFVEDTRRSEVVFGHDLGIKKGPRGVWVGSVAPPATPRMPSWYPPACLDGVLAVHFNIKNADVHDGLNWPLLVAAGVAHGSGNLGGGWTGAPPPLPVPTRTRVPSGALPWIKSTKGANL